MPGRRHDGDVLSYAARRIAWTVPILLLTLTLVFFAPCALGGDPLRHGQLARLSRGLDGSDVPSLRAREADGARDAGAAEAAVSVRVLREVLLVVRLRVVEGAG